MSDRIDSSSVLRSVAEANPSRDFLVLADDPGKTYSYGEFNTLVNRLANALSQLGVTYGQHVNVLLPNGLEYLSLSYAIKRLGAVEVAVNTEFKGPSLARILNLSPNAVLIVAEELADRLEPIVSTLHAPTALVIVGAGEKLARLPWRLGRRVSFGELVSTGSQRDPRITVSDVDTGCVVFTSGTTGPSKGCMIPHRCMLRAAESVRDALRLSEADVFYTAYPLFHMRAAVLDTLATVLVGGRVVLARKFSASRFWAEIRSNNVTVFSIIGTVMKILWNQASSTEDRNHNVRVTWGGPISVSPRDFKERFGIEVLAGEGCFGMSETGMVSISSLNEEESGKVKPSFQVRIADDHDEPVGRNQVGEILVRPTEPGVMFSGYLAMPEATVASWRNLWFHTGDFGRIDERDRLVFVGRKREMIRRGGHNISTWEVEEVLEQHQAVQESAVIGVSSQLGEEEVRAFVVLRHGKTVNVDELVRFCKERMASFMIPSRIDFVDEIPKTETGKPVKAALAIRP
jgi:carnitine-CoA ligase